MSESLPNMESEDHMERSWLVDKDGVGTENTKNNTIIIITSIIIIIILPGCRETATRLFLDSHHKPRHCGNQLIKPCGTREPRGRELVTDACPLHAADTTTSRRQVVTWVIEVASVINLSEA